MKHIKLFETTSEYNTWLNSNNFITPYIVKNKETKIVSYQKKQKYYDAEIEYLESTGTQYIDTGIIPDANTGIYIKASQLGNPDNYAVGLRNNNDNTRWCIGRSGNGWYWGYGVYDNTKNSYLSKNANIVECKLNYLNDSKWSGIGDDNTSAELTLPALSFTPLYNIRLFGSAGTIGSFTTYSGKIYAVKISQGTEIIMDLIPVKVGNIGYMYDKISRKLFGNNGTGEFILGPDK